MEHRYGSVELANMEYEKGVLIKKKLEARRGGGGVENKYGARNGSVDSNHGTRKKSADNKHGARKVGVDNKQ